MSTPFPPIRVACLHGGDLDPHITHGSLYPPHYAPPIGILIGSAIFAQLMAECLYFTMGRPFPLKIADLHGGCRLPSNVLILHLQRTVSAWIENPPLPAGLQQLRTLC